MLCCCESQCSVIIVSPSALSYFIYLRFNKKRKKNFSKDFAVSFNHFDLIGVESGNNYNSHFTFRWFLTKRQMGVAFILVSWLNVAWKPPRPHLKNFVVNVFKVQLYNWKCKIKMFCLIEVQRDFLDSRRQCTRKLCFWLDRLGWKKHLEAWHYNIYFFCLCEGNKARLPAGNIVYFNLIKKLSTCMDGPHS